MFLLIFRGIEITLYLQFAMWQPTADPSESNHPVPSRREQNNYSADRDRPSEEEESIKENQDVKVSFKAIGVLFLIL